MKRIVAEVQINGKGRYTVLTKTKRWWQRRWRTQLYVGEGLQWTQVDPWKGEVSTSLAWWLTNVAVRFNAEAREAQHAAR